jgi:hypothetical protein
MKRRIHRSRARCQRHLLAHKRVAARRKPKVKTDKQISPDSRARLIL